MFNKELLRRAEHGVSCMGNGDPCLARLGSSMRQLGIGRACCRSCCYDNRFIHKESARLQIIVPGLKEIRQRFLCFYSPRKSDNWKIGPKAQIRALATLPRVNSGRIYSSLAVAHPRNLGLSLFVPMSYLSFASDVDVNVYSCSKTCVYVYSVSVKAWREHARSYGGVK